VAGRRIDSFSHYATAQAAAKWTAVAFNLGAIVAGAGRNGNSAFRMNPNGFNPSYLSQTFDAQATWIVGFALNPPNPAANSGVDLLEIADTGTVQVSLQNDAAGHLTVRRGVQNGVLLGTSSFLLSAGAYDYWELLVTISPTVGVVQLRKNGVLDATLNLANQNTRASANSSANVVTVGNSQAAGPNANWDYSDLYVLDGSATAPNTFLGDVRVQAVLPNGAGALTQFAVTGAPTNWQAVSENPPDGDTSYVSSATPGNVDLYTTAGVTPTSGTVPLVQTCLYARKDDAGARSLQPELRQGGVNYAVGASHALGTSYLYYLDVLALDPTGAAWTIANVNADQIGVNEIA
jgi:hypothetical protein